MCLLFRHPDASGRPRPSTISQTLQGSNTTLLHWSTPEDDKTDGQVAVLGAPLSCGVQLYTDLQQLYSTA